MSKHKHHRGQNNQPQQAQPAQPEVQDVNVPFQSPAEAAMESVEDLLAVATGAGDETAAVVTEEVAEPEVPEQEVVQEPLAAPEPPAAKPVQPVEIPNAVEPAKEAVAKTEVPKPVKKGFVKVTAEDVYPSVPPALKKLVNIPNREHTPAGIRLKQMFDEYKAMMATKTEDKMELKKRVMKLYQLMSLGCPASLNDAIVAQDLVRVAFDCLVDGWGTVYTDSNMFCLDYTLPGGASAIDKLNMYWQAMIQMVEGAVANERIMFDVDRLAIVIKNPVVTSAIAKMKSNILERQKRMAENK